MDECKHGMNPEWCAPCRGDDAGARLATSAIATGHDTKQDQLDTLCDQLGVSRQLVSNGSSIPAHVLHTAARRCGVSTAGAMPVVCQRIVEKAGMTWTAEHDSRGSVSGGGSTVTYAGMAVLNRAVASLLN